MPQTHTPARRPGQLVTARRIGRNWRGLAAVFAVAAVYVLAMAIYPNLPFRQGYIGISLAALAVLLVSAMTDSPAMDGHLAEQWSLERLRRIRGWQVTDHLSFEKGDVDHVVVTPAAVLAVETEFHSTACAGTPAAAQRHRRDLDAAERAADNIRMLLRAEQVTDRAVVVPVLIVWGPGAPELREGHRLDNGVRVVDGAHPQRWMHLFNAPRLDSATRDDLHTRLERFAAAHVEHDAPAHTPLRKQIWQELRAGVANERTTRAARHERQRAMHRGHRLRLVAAPSTAITASVPAAGTAQAGG